MDMNPNRYGLGSATAAELRAEAARSCKTITAIANTAGLHRVAVSQRLNGQRAINLDDLGAIAAALNLPASTLIARAEQALAATESGGAA